MHHLFTVESDYHRLFPVLRAIICFSHNSHFHLFPCSFIPSLQSAVFIHSPQTRCHHSFTVLSLAAIIHSQSSVAAIIYSLLRLAAIVYSQSSDSLPPFMHSPQTRCHHLFTVMLPSSIIVLRVTVPFIVS
jgi:hypothetical protein